MQVRIVEIATGTTVERLDAYDERDAKRMARAILTQLNRDEFFVTTEPEVAEHDEPEAKK